MLPSFYFFLFLLKFRSSTRCSPLYRTIEKQSSSYTRSFIPIEIKISSCAPRHIFFSRIQIHVLPFAIVIQPFYNYGIFFFFLVSWQNWLVLWIWMQVGVSQSLVSRMGLPECDERVCCFSISEEWNATPLVSVLETLVAERVIRQEFALSKTRFFFFSPFSKKEKCSKWQKVALWYRIDPMVPYIRARATYLKWSTIAFYFLNVSQLLWSDKLTGDGDK